MTIVTWTVVRIMRGWQESMMNNIEILASF